MKKQITIICDSETTVPHLLNQTDFEVIGTGKEDTWCMVKREVVLGTSENGNVWIGKDGTITPAFNS